MGFSLLPRRAMARRGLIAALRSPSQIQGCLAPSLHLITRSYSNKLFVGGLSFRTDEDAVRRAFSQHGEVVEVKLISDRETGRPKGFGFVTFESETDAETARTKMTGQLLDGRVIRVDKATSSRPPLPSSGFSGGSASSSPISSSLPPVAEDWGTIPSNIVNIGAGAVPSTAASPAANSGGFGLDTSNPFDSSSFGQAAASWPARAPSPAPQTSMSTQIGSLSSVGSSNNSTIGSGSNFNTVGSTSTFSSNTYGSAAATPSSAPSAGWPGSTLAPSGSSSSNNSNNSSAGSTATIPISSAPSGGGTSAAWPSTTFASSASYGASTYDTKPFDSTTFGSASSSTSTFGSASPGKPSASATTSTSSVHTVDTTISNSSGSFSSGIPAATVSQSSFTAVPSSTSTVTNSAPSGTLNASKPLESSATAASSTASGETAPSTPSAHPLSSPALTSSGTFDFSNFSFNSSSYRDNDPPLPRRRPRPRPRPMQTMNSDLNSSTASLLETRSPFGSNNQFAETSIPKPKGTEVDFGLLNITAPCPMGMRPQGVFDIYIPDDLPEIPPPEPKPKPKPMSLSMFPHRQLPPLDAPYHTPEADNWSEIGKDPPKYDLSTLFPSMGELIKKEKEFHWDPYDFDPEATLPPEEVVIIFDSDYDDPV